MLTFTLDISSVIAAEKDEPNAAIYVEHLIEMARAEKIGIFITSGFEVDQRTASDHQRQANLDFLRC